VAADLKSRDLVLQRVGKIRIQKLLKAGVPKKILIVD
jgi:hypothetical protein